MTTSTNARGFLAVGLSIFISLLAQTTLLGTVSPRPDGVLAVVLAVSFARGPLDGAMCGFLGGVAEDALSGMSRGGFCLSYVVVGWLMGSIVKRLNSNNLLVLLFSGIVGSLADFYVLKIVELALGSAQVSLSGWMFPGWLLMEGLLAIGFLSIFRIWFAQESIRAQSVKEGSWIMGTRG